MFRLFVICLLLIATHAAADEPNSPRLSAPKGWGSETIRLPPGFAPDMNLQGVEHIRFAPGMMKPDSNTFFCYAFVFELKPNPVLTQAVIKNEILKYYQGLCKSVMQGKTPEMAPEKFKLDLKRAGPAGDQTKNSANDFIGTLVWLEPFATKKAQTLNMEIRTWSKDGQNLMFVAVSPQDRDTAIWKQLRTIRSDYLKK